MSRRPAHRHACRLEDSSKDSEDTPARSEISGYDSSASVRVVLRAYCDFG
ncbi:uncharacterized protein PITG_12803 [Phytophthora infestans T30-4]|uniref:Uncharacterized protein n=1 Tax=Phytophthora infestans (strain T30-4) TaxID=403677 RepID=D0NL72_PHYIT|nr:uncharacterized protein PITG_12803 [Phytophthora infestans T30-4]EEY60390.1 hypothetical protein PITG_12803 [Phytophthora infestans T30-4]|eukprot:XP_002900186.1 hypothetical protein PITG_12803 [Phytophthora infestans T30-4]